MSKATVGELEDRVVKIEKALQVSYYIRKKLEEQVGVLARSLAVHIGVDTLEGVAAMKISGMVSDEKAMTEGMVSNKPL